MGDNTPKRLPVPRAHHFVPQCWLAGFTETGDKTGRLWVTDLKRRKQWPSNPTKTGHRRDFYKTALPDPVAAEKAFGNIEDDVAPILKSLYTKPRSPRGNDLETLLIFAAFQYVRVPAFRPTVLRMADSIQRAWTAKALKNPASWRRALKKCDIPADSPGASYEEMMKFQSEGKYSLSAENDWYLMRGFSAAERAIYPSLCDRYWGVYPSSSGSFIGSDNPVAMDGAPGELVGFKSADIVVFPVNRYALMCGTNVPVKEPPVTLKRIARHNTFTMLTADEQVYSHEPDFCWLDENGSYQSDWRLFDKEKLVNASTRPEYVPERMFYTRYGRKPSPVRRRG